MRRRSQGSRPKSAFSLSTMCLAAHLGPRDGKHLGREEAAAQCAEWSLRLPGPKSHWLLGPSGLGSLRAPSRLGPLYATVALLDNLGPRAGGSWARLD